MRVPLRWRNPADNIVLSAEERELEILVDLWARRKGGHLNWRNENRDVLHRAGLASGLKNQCSAHWVVSLGLLHTVNSCTPRCFKQVRYNLHRGPQLPAFIFIQQLSVYTFTASAQVCSPPDSHPWGQGVSIPLASPDASEPPCAIH